MQFCPKWSEQLWLLIMPLSFQWDIKSLFAAAPLTKLNFLWKVLDLAQYINTTYSDLNMQFYFKWSNQLQLRMLQAFQQSWEHFFGCRIDSATFCHVGKNKDFLLCYWHSSCETWPTHGEAGKEIFLFNSFYFYWLISKCSLKTCRASILLCLIVRMYCGRVYYIKVWLHLLWTSMWY